MRTSSRLVRLAALPLAATLLVACGGGDDGGSGSDGSGSGDSSSAASDTDAYCQELEDAQQAFSAFDSAQPEQLQEAFDTFRQLAQDAPAEVEQDWATIDKAVETVETSLDSIGLEIGDLTSLQGGQVPEGVTPQDLQRVAGDLQSLANPEFSAAGDKIQEHAKSECGIDLGSTSSSPSPSDDASN